uniref:AlNc14C283G10145 protein n=1 Tax=Albugo laibachii Nc14 TaxID=890382 RepID=F0WUZ9_9STRA|nr:AlNc14C283G10145 [Albugo laibachii Nc14]|eukprot:CCA25235.1 AlNc14C283G10145 [Albugo laibachii Nc14]
MSDDEGSQEDSAILRQQSYWSSRSMTAWMTLSLEKRGGGGRKRTLAISYPVPKEVPSSTDFSEMDFMKTRSSYTMIFPPTHVS